MEDWPGERVLPCWMLVLPTVPEPLSLEAPPMSMMASRVPFTCRVLWPVTNAVGRALWAPFRITVPVGPLLIFTPARPLMLPSRVNELVVEMVPPPSIQVSA
ncbi:Uncharacterised protein [Bordetella pertussis]|nr:Uncharacterised protein [Bordetella pertussis]